jgi:hypothetical protein
MVCGSVWSCAVCAAKIAERRREELTAALDEARVRGWRVLLVSYTFSHGRGDELRSTLGRFLAAYRGMSGNRPYKRLCARYGVVGSIKSLEVTWGAANGWHPHAHVLLFLDRDVSDLDAFRRELYAAWSGAAARHGLAMTEARGLDVRATWGAVEDYVAKWGHEPKGRPWGAEDELVKAHSKRGRGERYTPWDLLRWVRDTGEAQPAALFREYAYTFKGRHQLEWSKGLRGELGVTAERSDEDLATAYLEDAVELALLTFAQWRAVRRLELRGELLELARTGDAAAVGEFVDEVVGCYLSGIGARGP